MRVFDLMFKDWRQILRDRRSLVFLLVMPVVFTGFMGFALRSPAPADPRLAVGLALPADDWLGARLADLLAASTTVRPVRLTEAEAADLDGQVRSGQLAAALQVPAGFTAAARAGEAPHLEVVADELTPAGAAAAAAVRGSVMRLLSAAEIGRLSAAVGGAAAWDAAAAQALDEWLRLPVTVDREPAAVPQAAAPTPSGMAQSSPGMLVQFAIFGLVNSAMILVLERQAGALQRLRTTSLSPAAIIAGHLLAMFSLVFVQGVVLVGVGQAAFGVDYLRQPLGVALMLAALALWVASLGLFISAVARGPEQVTLFALLAMFLFSALGGAWFPLEGVSAGFAAAGRLTPGAWAMTGLQNLVVRGQGFEGALRPAAALLGYAALFFGLAVWRLRRD